MPWTEQWYRTPQDAAPAADALPCHSVESGQVGHIFLPATAVGLNVPSVMRVESQHGQTLLLDTDTGASSPAGVWEITVYVSIGDENPAGLEWITFAGTGGVNPVMDASAPVLVIPRGVILLECTLTDAVRDGSVKVVGH